mgnify:CR=1 FL=1
MVLHVTCIVRDVLVFCDVVLRCGIVFCVSFCFQAEDGIRDLVRSRGLGDVYKRQLLLLIPGNMQPELEHDDAVVHQLALKAVDLTIGTVSYTHLTLPTSDLV